jgi:hypothetical protein
MPTQHRKSALAWRQSEWQPPGESEGLPAEVSLERSELGGRAVYHQGRFIGWMHANGDQWNAYLNNGTDAPGEKLGTFPLERAVAEILRARRARSGA